MPHKRDELGLFDGQVGHVATSLVSKGQKTVDMGLDTQLGQFWLMQMDVALESTEKLLYHYLPPVEDAPKGKAHHETLT